MRKLILAVMAMVLLACAPAWAELAPVSSSILAEDALEIDNATPGTSKTFLGTRLRGPLTQGTTTYAANDNGNPSGGCADDFTTPTTTAFLKTTGATQGEAYCLGDSQVGHVLTVVLATDGGQDFRVTPATKTGFTDVQLNDANDSVTMKYLNSTSGWIVTGNNGATIN